MRVFHVLILLQSATGSQSNARSRYFLEELPTSMPASSSCVKIKSECCYQPLDKWAHQHIRIYYIMAIGHHQSIEYSTYPYKHWTVPLYGMLLFYKSNNFNVLNPKPIQAHWLSALCHSAVMTSACTALYYDLQETHQSTVIGQIWQTVQAWLFARCMKSMMCTATQQKLWLQNSSALKMIEQIPDNDRKGIIPFSSETFDLLAEGKSNAQYLLSQAARMLHPVSLKGHWSGRSSRKQIY